MTAFTEKYNFVIDDDGKLYVRQSSATVRGHSIDTTKTKRFSVPDSSTRVTFYLAKSNHKYFKDCLETAEDLIADTYPPSIPDVVRSKVKRLNKNFGNTTEENIQVAKQYKESYGDFANEKADPVVGEAYVIVSLDTETTYPYHAAAVIAKDGGTNLTLEVFAANTDAQTRTETGTYHIYYLNSSQGIGFHDTWKDNSYLNPGNPVTIVIVKK